MVVVALLAFALQIVGSFGHTHLGQTSGGLAKLSIADGSAAATADLAYSQLALPHLGTVGDIHCAICHAGHLVASAVVVVAPSLPLPVVYLLLGPPYAAEVHVPRRVAAAFWSRGPPLS